MNYLVFDKKDASENYEDYADIVNLFNIAGGYTSHSNTVSYVDLYNPKTDATGIKFLLLVMLGYELYLGSKRSELINYVPNEFI